MRVITRQAAGKILAAGGLAAPTERRLRHTAQRLDALALHVFDRHYDLRWQDEGRKRLRDKPHKEIRLRLHIGLEEIWMELPKIKRGGQRVRRAPHITYSQNGEYEGNFVRFSQAFLGELAAYVESNAVGAEWKVLVKYLRQIEKKGGKINPLLTALTRVVRADDPLTHLQSVVLDIVVSQPEKAHAAAISAELHKPIDEVRAILKSLTQAGRIKKSA